MISHDTAFEQWFASYAETHKLPKGSPFRLAIWHHCKDAWEAGQEEQHYQDIKVFAEVVSERKTNLTFKNAFGVDISENNS